MNVLWIESVGNTLGELFFDRVSYEQVKAYQSQATPAEWEARHRGYVEGAYYGVEMLLGKDVADELLRQAIDWHNQDFPKPFSKVAALLASEV